MYQAEKIFPKEDLELTFRNIVKAKNSLHDEQKNCCKKHLPAARFPGSLQWFIVTAAVPVFIFIS
jgi:hypothetical protein